MANWLRGVVGMTNADINAIPDDKWNANFGGCTRPASAIAGDALGMLHWITGALKGEAGEAGSGEPNAEAMCATKTDATAAFDKAADELADALSSASDETLNKVIRAPWGSEAPLFMLAQISIAHVWYHDGQFNYIHCLLGDDKIHWTG